MLRLVAYAPDGVRRFPVHRAELVIGSEPDCDICLPYTGVAHYHARLAYNGEQLRIEDLGTRRGILISGRRVRESNLEVLDEIRLGGVTLLVEDVQAEPEAAEAEPAEAEVAEGPPQMTAGRMLDHIAHLSEWVLADRESRRTSESLIREVVSDFGGGMILLLQGDLNEAGIKQVVVSDESWLGNGEELVEQVRRHLGERPMPAEGVDFPGTLAGEPAWLCAHLYAAVERSYVLITALPRFSPQSWSPVSALKTLGDMLILGLVHHVGWYEPILPGHRGQSDLTLDPALVVGESPAMQKVLDRLRVALTSSVNVLLRGEPGVGKELLARSLHLSSPFRQGPFVVASCTGAKATQIEADLFGAEVQGREGPLRREGKIFLADGGTLFLDRIDLLPMEVQARLMRFLRTQEVEPMGSRLARRVQVRVVASSEGSLDSAVARDLFRVDLAYHLSQLVIEVPPLRDRREDLPLMVQSYVNRFCHETGKRVQGITVKAMSALLHHAYPGNVRELENIVRQAVYLCPSGRPMDVELLPAGVRLSPVRSSGRVDASSDLELETLVADTEASAIREALRRTSGNKSQAAKLLRLSRNGLAMKMERYGLKG